MSKNHSSDHTVSSVAVPAKGDIAQRGRTRILTRRTFIQAIAVSAASAVVGACGGSSATATGTGSSVSGGGGSLPGTNPSSGATQPLGWRTVPTITFTQGVATSVSIAGFLNDPNGDIETITKNSAALPPGVTYDAANKRFIYDGVGGVGSTGGHVLTASDGNP